MWDAIKLKVKYMNRLSRVVLSRQTTEKKVHDTLTSYLTFYLPFYFERQKFIRMNGWVDVGYSYTQKLLNGIVWNLPHV